MNDMQVVTRLHGRDARVHLLRRIWCGQEATELGGTLFLALPMVSRAKVLLLWLIHLRVEAFLFSDGEVIIEVYLVCFDHLIALWHNLLLGHKHQRILIRLSAKLLWIPLRLWCFVDLHRLIRV